MKDKPDNERRPDTCPCDGDKQHDDGPCTIDIYAEPTFSGYTQSELLARYPRLLDMPPKTRLRKMIHYAWVDRQWEHNLQDMEEQERRRTMIL
jgi:hypothetical protein